MKTQSIALTIGTAFLAFGLLLFLIQILSRKLRSTSENETGLKLSYTIHVGGLLIAGCLHLAKALPLVPEGFEIQWVQHQNSFVLDALQLVATIVGFSFLWIGLTYLSVQALASVILGKRQETIEMERDNFSFFLSKAIGLIGLSLLAASVIEDFLRLFMPNLNVPFYH